MCCSYVSRLTEEPNRRTGVFRFQRIRTEQEPIFSVSVLSVPVPGSFGSVPGSRFFVPRPTYQWSTRGSRLSGVGSWSWDMELEGKGRDTRFIQARVAGVASPMSCLGYQVWRPALGVGSVELSSQVPGPPLYSPEGGCLVSYKVGVLVWLHGTSPSRIAGKF
jgi:hypothetical protein